MIRIAPNSWPGFGGLYKFNEAGIFSYVINNVVYNAYLEYDRHIRAHRILNSHTLVPPFEVDLQGSEVLYISSENMYMLYQRRSNGRFVELIPRQSEFVGHYLMMTLEIPLPNGQAVDGEFPGIELDPIEDEIYGRFDNQPTTYNQILNLLNNEFPAIQEEPIAYISVNNLQYSVNDDGIPLYTYLINGNVYYGYNLQQDEEVIVSNTPIPSFNVDPNGSQLLAIRLGAVDMIYQLTSSGRFVELIPRQPNPELIRTISALEVPLSNGDRMPLREIYPWVIQLEGRRLYLNRITDYDQILAILNERTPIAPQGTMPPVAPIIEDHALYMPLIFESEPEQRMITIASNSWPGFGGLYHHDDGHFAYIINNVVYDRNLERDHDLSFNQVVPSWNLVPPFEVDTEGSDILLIESLQGHRYMLYQRRDGRFIELLPRQPGSFDAYGISSPAIPSPDGAVQLEPISPHILNRLNSQPATYDQILDSLNAPRSTYQSSMYVPRNIYRSTPQRQSVGIYNPDFIPSQQQSIGIYNPDFRTIYQRREIANYEPQPENTLFKESYETLLKRLYNLPVNDMSLTPQSLIINGTRVNFIEFSQVNSIQIERYIIDPLLQPYSNNFQNRILTIFAKNDITYLVRARYDPVSNKIFPPI